MLHTVFDAGDKRYGPRDPWAEGRYSGTYGNPKWSTIPIPRHYSPQWAYDATEDWWKSYFFAKGTSFKKDDILRTFLVPAGSQLKGLFIHARKQLDLQVQFRLVTTADDTEVAFSPDISFNGDEYIEVSGWKVAAATPGDPAEDVPFPYLTQEPMYLEMIVGAGTGATPVSDLDTACFTLSLDVFMVHDYTECGCEVPPCPDIDFPPAECMP